MYTDIPARIRTAERIADRVGQFRDVGDIYLFGSLARQDYGHDIDMIVTVSDQVAEQWLRMVANCGYSIYRASRIRRQAAESLLFPGLALAAIDMGFNSRLLDIFLFPTNWLENLDVLQHRLPHRDPRFMRKIALDARRFNHRTGEFDRSPVLRQNGFR